MSKEIDLQYRPQTYFGSEGLEKGLASQEDRAVLESVHPMFMGGNYLPDPEVGEVEIARISIRSTTFDVTSVYARLERGTIHYRLVDEYEGDTLQEPAETKSTEPITLVELADFFMKAWPLIHVLKTNFRGNTEAALAFFSVDSLFYPDFDSLCRLRVRGAFPKP